MYPLLFNLGMTEIVVILLIIVLLFGGKKIPELMRGMGRGVREFKDAMEKPASDTPQSPAASGTARARRKPSQSRKKSASTDQTE